MIDSVSSNPIPPIQQRSAVNDGDHFQQSKSNEKTSLPGKNSDPITQTEKSGEKKKLEEIVKGLNDFLKPKQISLKFKLHEKLNEYYCQVIDDHSNEVISEIPSKKLLDAYAIMAEQLGFIIDKKI
jgi:flagellar protein FlaG